MISLFLSFIINEYEDLWDTLGRSGLNIDDSLFRKKDIINDCHWPPTKKDTLDKGEKKQVPVVLQ